jgi:hypothetical protein
MIWRATKYQGYFVNEDGEVKLWSGKVTRGSVRKGPDGRDKGGYLRITIRRTYETPNVHRLVCEAFHGPPPTPGHQAAHNNGNKLDNRASNLRWATIAENNAYRLKHGTYDTGENHKRARLTWAKVKDIRRRYPEESVRKLAAWAGVSEHAVMCVVRQYTWIEPGMQRFYRRR